MHIGVLTPRYISQFIIKIITNEYHCSAAGWKDKAALTNINAHILFLRPHHETSHTLGSENIL